MRFLGKLKYTEKTEGNICGFGTGYVAMDKRLHCGNGLYILP